MRDARIRLAASVEDVEREIDGLGLAVSMRDSLVDQPIQRSAGRNAARTRRRKLDRRGSGWAANTPVRREESAARVHVAGVGGGLDGAR
jgi:hypothetical protein